MKKAPVCVVLLVLAGCFSGHADAPEPNEIRVRRGPFQGCEGVVIQRRDEVRPPREPIARASRVTSDAK